MDSSLRPGRLSLPSLTLYVAFAAVGCATPGLPRPPSLNLPETARELSATRIGNTVELRFTVPSRSTDKLPLRGSHLIARFCRALDTQPCQYVASPMIVVPLDTAAERHSSFTWIDKLSEDLAHGNPRPLSYSVELLNISGHSAGQSPPAFTAAGEATFPVGDLSAEGSRLGILVRWNDSASAPGDVLIEREDLSSSLDAKTPKIVHLATPSVNSGSTPGSLLDTTAKPGIPYRYTATRRLMVELSGRTTELFSTPSPAIDLTLRPIYPPPVPTGLTAVAFTGATNGFAVDLIWQPIDDTGLIAPFAGYNVYRASTGEATRLNSIPLTVPAFHDTTALPNTAYRYSVTAVDSMGNESGPVGTAIQAP